MTAEVLDAAEALDDAADKDVDSLVLISSTQRAVKLALI
jgi:hypothetical protein